MLFSSVCACQGMLGCPLLFDRLHSIFSYDSSDFFHCTDFFHCSFQFFCLLKDVLTCDFSHICPFSVWAFFQDVFLCFFSLSEHSTCRVLEHFPVVAFSMEVDVKPSTLRYIYNKTRSTLANFSQLLLHIYILEVQHLK